MQHSISRPSNAFVFSSWLALCGGMIVFLIGLQNAEMQLNEKGYYFAVLILGLFSSISLQKSVRDKVEGMQETALYTNLCWVAFAISVLLISIGLWNAELALSEKGFYGVTFFMCLFSAAAVQKNARDTLNAKKENTPDKSEKEMHSFEDKINND